MDLVILVLVIVVIGFLIYLLTTRVPMPPYWAGTIQVVALILMLLWLLTRLGVTITNVLRG